MNANLPIGRRVEIFFDDGGDLNRYYNEVLINQEYRDVPPGNFETVVDLGANLGMFSMWIYERTQRIYAIEASEANYRNLAQTVRVNDLNKIQPFHLAIAGKAGTRTLVSDGDCGGYTIYMPPKPGASAQTVQAMTLNEFLDLNRIQRVDILKIDVEGAENEIFTADDFPKAIPKLPYIIGEFHCNYIGEVIPSESYLFAQMPSLRALRAHGYEVTIPSFFANRQQSFIARRPS